MNRCKYILVVIVALLFRSGTCIKCYNCISTTNAGCLDPKGSNLKAQECDVELVKKLSVQVTQYANKIGAAFGLDIDNKSAPALPIVCQKIESVVNGEKMVVRGCHLGDTEDLSVCKNLDKRTNGVVTHCSICSEDECNAAHWLSPFSFGTLIISVLTLRAWNLFF